MAYAELLEEVKDLSENNAAVVLDFVKYIKSKDGNKKPERKSNLLAGGLIYMADDFDATPDCFKEYMS